MTPNETNFSLPSFETSIENIIGATFSFAFHNLAKVVRKSESLSTQNSKMTDAMDKQAHLVQK